MFNMCTVYTAARRSPHLTCSGAHLAVGQESGRGHCALAQGMLLIRGSPATDSLRDQAEPQSPTKATFVRSGQHASDIYSAPKVPATNAAAHPSHSPFGPKVAPPAAIFWPPP